MKFVKLGCPIEIELGKTDNLDQRLVINRSLNLATLEEIIHETIAAHSTNLNCFEIKGQQIVVSYAVNFIEDKTSRPVLDMVTVKRLIVAVPDTQVDMFLLYNGTTRNTSFVPYLNENGDTNTTIFSISLIRTEFEERLRQWLEESWDIIMSK